MNSVQNALKKMNANRQVFKEKGNYGEEAVLEVLKELSKSVPSIILHSFKYPYASNSNKVIYPGNVHLIDGKYVPVENREGFFDEIDLLFITDYRIFAIEAKARSGTWEIYDYWVKQNSKKVDKSPIAQSEKHARHLYHTIYTHIPNCDEKYIIPLAVFVDKATIKDSRSDTQRYIIPVAILDTLKEKIRIYNTPLDYRLSKEAILDKLLSVGSGTLYR